MDSSQQIKKAARALLSIAESEGNELALAKELRMITDELGSNTDLRRLLNDPEVSEPDRIKALLSVLEEDASRSAAAAAGIIISLKLHDRPKELYEAYEKNISCLKKQANAEVESAVPLGRETLDRLKAEIDKKTGLDVSIKNLVNRRIIAGLIIRVGDLCIDLSVRGRLETLKSDLKSIEPEENFGI